MRYSLSLIAIAQIGLALWLEFVFFHDFPWEDKTSWSFFLFSGVGLCLLCKANFKVNLAAKLLACFCILSVTWVLFVSLLGLIIYIEPSWTTEFEVLCALISYVSLLFTKPVPLLFLVGICFCLRFKSVPILCIPFLISGWLAGWLDVLDYRTFVFSSSLIVIICSLATIFDEWRTNKSKSDTPDEVRSVGRVCPEVPAVDQPSLSLSRSSSQRSKDPVGDEPPLPEDFSPPPCI